MKNILIRYLFLGLSILSSITLFNSCVNNDDLSITELDRYTDRDIKSYSDLFDVFWTTMDQRYNYFYEQKRRDDMDWSAIYREYSSKFKALKTFGRSTDNEKEIYKDYVKAVQYFKEIMDPIMDRHFSVKITFPLFNSQKDDVVFYGGMLTGDRRNIYRFASKYNYMKERVSPDSFISNNFAIGGYLNSNPDIYYFTFSQFTLSRDLQINLLDKYFSLDQENPKLLTEHIIDNSKELNSIQDINTRKKVRDFTLDILNKWNEFPKSKEVTSFNQEITKFKNTEIISDEFISAGQKIISRQFELRDYGKRSNYSTILTPETAPYINWFIDKMNNHVLVGYNMIYSMLEIETALNRAGLYRKFLNPLHKGEIKKIILDLRGNGGGYVVDGRFFSDRFITKSEVFAYQRTKQGNGRFNYTPWVEVKAKPHQFGIPANIPITILTDKGSMSMSEITTLMLKSQGNHVVSIGDYSAGATAGLGSNDYFNGGTRDLIAGRLDFYMPLMAFKDAKGEVIEGIGVKPDIYVTPPTDDEVRAMVSSPKTFVDRVLNEAIKYLSSK